MALKSLADSSLFSLQVEFTPTSIHKFDTYIQVNVRGSKTVSLRVGGTIEPPCVDIDVVSRSGLQRKFFCCPLSSLT